jgi:hypothetical protein
MPILPFPELPKPPSPVGGTGSCVTGGGGFSPPQCPITTTRTVCEPKTVTSCSCINGGPKNPISPASWSVSEVGSDGSSNIGYEAGSTTYNPTTQTVTLDGIPSSYNPPAYYYTGYMRLTLTCSDGSSHVLDSWTTNNGHPTDDPTGSHSLQSSFPNPCGASSSSPDLGDKDTQAECNQAAAANSSYNISWSCVDIIVDDCTETSETTFTDATPAIQASILAAIAARIAGDFPIDLKDLSPTARASLIEAMIDSSPYPGAKEIIKNIHFDPATGTIRVDYHKFGDPQISGFGEKAYKKFKEQMESVVKGYNETFLKGTQKITTQSTVGKKFLELLKKGGKLSTSLASKLSPCLRRIPAIAILLGGAAAASSADAFAYAIADGGLGDSDISWSCEGAGGGDGGGDGGNGPGTGEGNNNEGQLNSNDGIFLPNGNYKNSKNQISNPIQTPDSQTPSRSNFIRGNFSTNINMTNLSNTSVSSSDRNNHTMNLNYGIPMTSFPLLKVANNE